MAAGSLDFRLNLLANTTGLQQGMNGAKFAVNALVAAMAAVGVGLSVQGLAQAADSYTNLSARINIATKDGGDFTSAMSGVHQVALMTNTTLDATGMLFTKVNDIGKQMGLTQQESLDLVKTINMAVQTGGGSAASSEAAITQLTQALQSGVLRGDEFNSIMEQAPGISSALAKSLGVTTGELRKMAGEGQLSATKVIKALKEQSASIQADYDKFPLTIGNALQKIQTQWQITIGTMDQANGASATVAQWLSTLADNMGIVTALLDDLGNGFVWAGNQLKTVDSATIEALKTALMTAYEALKELGSTVGIAFEAAVEVINTVLGQLFDFGSAIDTADDQTNGFTKTLQVINIAIGALSDGFSVIGIGVNLFVGALYSAASAWANLVSKFSWGDVKTEAIASMTAMQAKSEEYYQKASDGAMNFKSKTVEGLDEIGKTQAQKDADAVASSKAKLDQLLADQKTEVEGKKVSEGEKLKAVQTYADLAITANGGVLDSSVQLELQSKGYMVAIDSAGKAVVTSMAEAQKATEDSAKATELAQEKAKQAETVYQEFIKSSAAEKIQIQKQIEQAKVSGDLTVLASAQASLAAINTKEAELNEIRNQRNAEAISGAKSVSKAAESAAKGAAEALGINIDVSLNQVSKSFKEAGGHVDTLSKDITGLGATGANASNLIYEGWSKWLEKAKSPAEIDFAKTKLDEFEKKGGVSTQQVEMGMQAVQRATAKLPDNLDEVGAAFERLGIKTKEQLKLAAQSALADFNTIQASGQATTAELQKGYERVVQAAHASGNAGVIAASDAKAASLGLRIQVDETGQATIQTANSMEAAMYRVGNATQSAQQNFRDLGATAREEALSSTEAWAKAVDASSEEFKSRGLTGKSMSSYTLEGIKEKLRLAGITDEKQLNMKANELFKADASTRKTSIAQNQWDKAGSLPGFIPNNIAINLMAATNKEYVDVMVSKLKPTSQNGSIGNVNNLAPNIPSTNIPTSSNDASKTVRYEFISNGKTVALYGSQGDGDGDAMSDLLSQLEAIKKSS